MANHLRNFQEAARELGVTRETIRDIVRTRGIATKPMPYNGQNKGLDDADMRVLRKALGLTAACHS